MGEVYLQSRIDFLLGSQNPDGGWGYSPGKKSWMEPTVYSMLALQNMADAGPAVERAWQQLLTWQLPDGSWRAGAQVSDGTWVTALGVLAACRRGSVGRPATQGVSWLMNSSGAESRWTVRLFSYFHWLQTDLNVDHRGWPWRPGTSAWVEPTAITLLALKKSLRERPDKRVVARIHEGEEFLLSRRDRDGGWNSGNPNVLKYDLPSYPETTALAILGLQGRTPQELAAALDVARRYYGNCKSSFAKAWLTIALRCHGDQLTGPDPAGKRISSDILLSALQALGHPDGGYGWFKTAAPA